MGLPVKPCIVWVVLRVASAVSTQSSPHPLSSNVRGFPGATVEAEASLTPTALSGRGEKPFPPDCLGLALSAEASFDGTEKIWDGVEAVPTGIYETPCR